MTLAPKSLTELSAALLKARTAHDRIQTVDLTALDRVLDHTPEDMTATVQAGATLASFQSRLRRGGQWLPLDPPSPEHITIRDLLDANLSGPRRFGYGPARDHVIGIKVALADGSVIKSGGQVVKNVAGYDLLKLFIGARGTLGVIVEVTFKLRPLPEAEQIRQATFQTLDPALEFLETLDSSELDPVIIDLHRSFPNGKPGFTAVVGFAGALEDVDQQSARIEQLGAATPANLEYPQRFFARATHGAPIHILSVLPSQLGPALRELGNAEFVARAGNGLVYHRGEPRPEPARSTNRLSQRVKEAFDPHHVFPEIAP